VVIRTGGGIYYDRFQGNRVFDMVRNPPEGLDPSLTYGLAQNINPSNIILAPPTLYAADPTGKLPTTYNYQFSVQTKLPWNLVLDTAYVGDVGRHLQDNRNLNPIPYGADFLPQNQDPTLTTSALAGNSALQPNFLRPLRGYNQIALYESAATSNYNALQLNVTRRVGRILFFGAAYTWSKALTTATTDTTYMRADNLTKAADYGPANFDRRQVLSLNYVANLPDVKSGNRFTRALTNGWQLSGVTQMATGAPFTPTFTISGVSSQNITGNVVAGNPAPGALAYVYEGARIGYVSGCRRSLEPIEFGVLLCSRAGQQRTGIRGELAVRSWPGELRYGAAEAIRDQGTYAITIPFRRLQRIQPREFPDAQHDAEFFGQLPEQSDRREQSLQFRRGVSEPERVRNSEHLTHY
jgi:hypothetical protein